jgi:thiol-disulfide isomerase/thioredoxin
MRIGLILALTLLVGCSQPDFYDIDGNGISLAKLQEKALVVNYWATWCGPCIKEIPELNELAATHAAELTVVGVNFDQPAGEEQKKQAEKMKIEFPVIAGEPAGQLGVAVPEVLPTTYIFAPGGGLLATLVGPQTEASILEAIAR